MGQVERMKIEVLGALDGLIDQINTQQMGIPLGNLLLPDLLAGTGPVLPVKAVSLTVSNADFFSDFQRPASTRPCRRSRSNSPSA